MLEEWQIRRYARHILLAELGGAGQERLLDVAIRIPALDVPGRECALWLARSGIGTLSLSEDGSPAPEIDEAGLLHARDVGRPLIEAVRERLLEHHPHLKFAPDATVTAKSALGVEGALAVVRELALGGGAKVR